MRGRVRLVHSRLQRFLLTLLLGLGLLGGAVGLHPVDGTGNMSVVLGACLRMVGWLQLVVHL